MESTHPPIVEPELGQLKQQVKVEVFLMVIPLALGALLPPKFLNRRILAKVEAEPPNRSFSKRKITIRIGYFFSSIFGWAVELKSFTIY